MVPAVFRHVTDSMGDGLLRRANRDVLIVKKNLAGVRRRDPKQHARQFRASRPDEPREADDFSGANLQAGCASTRNGISRWISSATSM